MTIEINDGDVSIIMFALHAAICRCGHCVGTIHKAQLCPDCVRRDALIDVLRKLIDVLRKLPDAGKAEAK